MGEASYPRVNGAIVIAGAFVRDGVVFLPRKKAVRILAFPGWTFSEIRYEKRERRERDVLRREFDRTVRSAFLSSLVRSYLRVLETHGFAAADIGALARGEAPEGFEVHHIIPIDDLGTNSPSNLMLIRSFEHSALTAFQNRVTSGLSPGQAAMIDFPVPPPGTLVWPAPRAQETEEEELWAHRRERGLRSAG